VRDAEYSPFTRQSPPERPLEALVFVMARRRDDTTDSMRGSLRPGPHGVESVDTPNGELYRSQWFAAEALARVDLPTHQGVLAAIGWTPVPFHP
jgi:hypothetical protein